MGLFKVLSICRERLHPATDLLPHLEILSKSGRQIFLQMIERTKSQILVAPEEAFTLRKESEDPADWNYVSSCWEFDATPEQFQVWVKKFHQLMAELNEITKVQIKIRIVNLIIFLLLHFKSLREQCSNLLKKKKNRNTIFLPRRSNLFYRINLL